MSESSSQFELEVLVQSEAATAIDALASECELSRTRLKQAMASGAVWLRRGAHLERIRRATRKLKVDDRLTLYYSARILDEQVASPQLLIDEKDYSVWIKPKGVHSQGTRYGDHCAMVRLVEQELHSGGGKADSRAVLLVHRLDRFASGLMLLAHNRQSAARLSKMFRERTITKRYKALVHGELVVKPENSRIEANIDDKSACTRLLSAASNKHCSLLEVQIDTGRKHQVRRHLSGIGHPIVGDRQYGGVTAEISTLANMDLQLCASYLEFSCPISQQQKCYTLPDSYLAEMKRALSQTLEPQASDD